MLYLEIMRFTPQIHNKIKLLHNYKAYGKESQQVIASECLQAEYFFYPTNFLMKHSVIVLMTQLYHTVCIYHPISSLITTIADRGLSINHNLKRS